MDLMLSPIILKTREQKKKEKQDKRIKIIIETLYFYITAANFPQLKSSAVEDPIKL